MKKINLVLSALISLISFTCLFADESQEIRLGATIPLSGEYSTYGKLIQDGVELAREDLIMAGHNVSIIYEDLPLPGKQAITAIRKLITEDKIHGLAGNFWNPALPTMAPLLMRNRILSFHTAAADDLILAAGDYIFSTNAKVKDEAKALADLAYHKYGAKKVVVLYVATTFGEDYSKHFKAHFEKNGGKVIFLDMTMLGSSDNRTVLSKVKGLDPDLYFFAHFGTNLGIMLKQARQLGIKKPILSVYEAEDPSVLKAAGVYAEGLKFFVAEAKEQGSQQENFLARFKKRYEYLPGILGKNAYDATLLLTKTLVLCDLEPECTKEKLYQVKNYPGISGTFSIDKEGAAKKDFVLKTVRDSKFVRASN